MPSPFERLANPPDRLESLLLECLRKSPAGARATGAEGSKHDPWVHSPEDRSID